MIDKSLRLLANYRSNRVYDAVMDPVRARNDVFQRNVEQELKAVGLTVKRVLKFDPFNKIVFECESSTWDSCVVKYFPLAQHSPEQVAGLDIVRRVQKYPDGPFPRVHAVFDRFYVEERVEGQELLRTPSSAALDGLAEYCDTYSYWCSNIRETIMLREEVIMYEIEHIIAKCIRQMRQMAPLPQLSAARQVLSRNEDVLGVIRQLCDEAISMKIRGTYATRDMGVRNVFVRPDGKWINVDYDQIRISHYIYDYAILYMSALAYDNVDEVLANEVKKTSMNQIGRDLAECLSFADKLFCSVELLLRPVERSSSIS